MFSEHFSKRTQTILGLEHSNGWLIQLDDDQFNNLDYNQTQALILRGHPVYLALPGARTLSIEAQTQLSAMGVPYIKEEKYIFGLAGHLMVDPQDIPRIQLELDAKVISSFASRAFQQTLELYMSEQTQSVESLPAIELLQHIQTKKNYTRILGMLCSTKELTSLYPSSNTLNKHIYPTLGRYALAYLNEFGYQTIKH